MRKMAVPAKAAIISAVAETGSLKTRRGAMTERRGNGGQQDGVHGDGEPARTLIAGGAAMHGDGSEDEQGGDGWKDVSGKFGAREGEECNGDDGPEEEEDLKGEAGCGVVRPRLRLRRRGSGRVAGRLR